MVLDTTHAEKGKPFLDILRIALRTIHALISENELLKLLTARITGVLKNRHKTSLLHIILYIIPSLCVQIFANGTGKGLTDRLFD